MEDYTNVFPPPIVTTVYVRKEEEKVYNALLMDSLTVHDFKLQVLRPLPSKPTNFAACLVVMYVCVALRGEPERVCMQNVEHEHGCHRM